MLSLPLSNADAEHAFSQVNIIKSKVRNHMANKTLAGILHVLEKTFGGTELEDGVK